MLTLVAARERLRRWLDDESATPLWPDTALDEGLSVGLDEVAGIFPRIIRLSVPVDSGADAITAPFDLVRLSWVFDPSGVPVAAQLFGDEIRAVYGGTFRAGGYDLVYETVPTLPSSDDEEVPCPSWLERLLIGSAAYWCLSQRATSEAKRGGTTASERNRLQSARMDLDRLRRDARRFVRPSAVAG